MVTLLFWAFELLPGKTSDENLLLGGGVVSQELEAHPMVRYWQYCLQIMQGDLGQSLSDGQGVTEKIVAQAIPTIQLGLMSWILGIILGVMVGGITLNGGYVAQCFLMVENVLLGIPVYWSATILLYLFVVLLGWFPAGGGGRISQLVLPSLTLALALLPSISLSVRHALYDQLNQNYALTAKAKGLHSFRIVWKHLMPNASITVIPLAFLELGFLLRGTVLTERLFSRPGLGQVLLRAVLQQDYPVVVGGVIVGVVLMNMIQMLADLLVWLLDPRVRG
ncbi:MAG: ABC transporter permease [Phototrophicaceae bacterium]